MTKPSPFRNLKTSPEIIRQTVMPCLWFPTSVRNVEYLLDECGVDVSDETIRFCWHKFGPVFVSEIRRRGIEDMFSSRLRWSLDEMFVKFNCQIHYLYRFSYPEGIIDDTRFPSCHGLAASYSDCAARIGTASCLG